MTKASPLRFLFLTICLPWLALATSAAAAVPPAPGDMAPDFKLRTLAGDPVTLRQFTEQSPTALLVLRGWPGYQCPFCTAQVNGFVQAAAKFKQAGIRVVMVYPGPSEYLDKHATEFVGNKDFPQDFILVLDPDYTFTNAYGLRWDKPKETAYPSTFAIAKGGKIFFSHVSHSHGDRVSAEALLETFQAGR